MGVLIAVVAIALGLGGASTVSTSTVQGHVLLQPVEPRCGDNGCAQQARVTESSANATITPRRIWLHPHQDVRLVFAYRPGR